MHTHVLPLSVPLKHLERVCVCVCVCVCVYVCTRAHVRMNVVLICCALFVGGVLQFRV